MGRRTPARREHGHTLPLLLLLAAAVVALSPASSAARSYALRLDVRGPSGEPLEARVSIRSEADGRYYPLAADTSVMAHDGYCYPGGAEVQVPEGVATVTVSRGPEWIPRLFTVNLNKNRLVAVTLQRLLDLRPLGLYSGDLHAHVLENPPEFTVTMAQALRVARAEDVAVLHLLDNEAGFTGAPDPVSDAGTVIYRSFEHRNQTYGHIPLAGLREPVTPGCCLAPAEPWPMLGALREQVAGPGRALFVLGHPHTTDEYDLQTAWPGAGLGREFPVLAALGELDGMDVASYSNDPETCWDDWAEALSSGCRVTPTAGSDAVLCWYRHPPPGGWRVYAALGAGAPLGYDAWVEAVRAGRTFVTSLPLIASFAVAGHAPGDAWEVAEDTLEAPVALDVACVTGLATVSLEGDGGTLWSVDLSARGPVPLRWDTTFTLRAATPGWLALRVTGVAGSRALLGLPALAQSNAVRLWRDGGPRRDCEAVDRMLARVDRLQALLAARHWTVAWHRDSAYARLDRARAALHAPWTLPPDSFALLTDVEHGPVPSLQWAAAGDGEPCDRVRYRVTYCADSAFAAPETLWTDQPQVLPEQMPRGDREWWRIEAIDRGGNATACLPPAFAATITAPLAVPVTPARPLARAWPNPSRGMVRLEGLGPDAIIVDVAGRRVAGPGLGRDGRGLSWDGRSQGRRVPAGVYRALSRSTGARVSFVIVE